MGSGQWQAREALSIRQKCFDASDPFGGLEVTKSNEFTFQ